MLREVKITCVLIMISSCRMTKAIINIDEHFEVQSSLCIIFLQLTFKFRLSEVSENGVCYPSLCIGIKLNRYKRSVSCSFLNHSMLHHHWLQFIMPLALPLKSSVILSLAAINQCVDFSTWEICPGRHPSPEKSGLIDVENLFRLITSFFNNMLQFCNKLISWMTWTYVSLASICGQILINRMSFGLNLKHGYR